MTNDVQSYEGSCHCGAVSFTVTLTIDSLLNCNCSICSKLGSLWVFAPKSAMILVGDESAYGAYQFGAKNLTHRFCKTCGVETFAEGVAPDGTPTFGINVRSLKEFDISAYDVRDHDGASA